MEHPGSAFTGGNSSPDSLHEGKFYRYLGPESRDTATHGLALARCLCGTTVPGPDSAAASTAASPSNCSTATQPPLQLLADCATTG